MTQRVKILLLMGLLLIGGTQAYFSGLDPDDSNFNADSSNTGQAAPINVSQKNLASIAFSVPPTQEKVILATPRNIFAPLGADLLNKKKVIVSRTPPPAPKPQVRPPVALKSPPPAPVQPAGPNLEARARLKAEKEMNRYTFLGYLKRAGEQHAFLSNGQALYIVKQGEVVEGEIRLKSIKESAVVLSKVLKGMDSTAEATLQLTKDGNGA